MTLKAAIVGRPNVGKSTLFNRLAGRKIAIVHDKPGVTRDRKETEAKLRDIDLQIIDTAGFEYAKDDCLEKRMWQQTERAIKEADVCLFLFDARDGIQPYDEFFAGLVRQSGKPVILLANKCEGKLQEDSIHEAYKLGLGEPIPFSAEHGLGLLDLYDALKPFDRKLEENVLPEEDGETENEALSREEKDRLEDEKYKSRPIQLAIVGRPNVGKSTLLSVTSNAHPKIANYHFTTLFPNLGVVYVTEGTSFVMADIPGIIEGASDGAGLGHDFLRHIDRCRLLVHLVDVSGSEGRDPVEDFEAINTELRAYSDVLGSRMQIVAANKCDLLGDDRTNIDRLRAHVEAQGYEFFEMSAAAHTGTRELVQACAAKLAEIPPVPPYEADYVPPEPEVGTSDELQIRHFDDLWVVEGPWLQRLMGSINFGDYESRMYFDRVLRQSGLFDRLEAMGIEEGDTVSIYDLDFEFRF